MSGFDYVLIAAYALLVLWIGLRASRQTASGDDYVLAGRNIPTWLAFSSMVATELSAATFIGVPQAAYRGDWSYLQFAFGAFAAKLIIAWRVIPVFHRRGVITVYGFLGERYGPRTQRASAIFFVAGRLLASGVRLFIAALAASAVTGWRIEIAIAVSGLVAGLYTVWGGIRAVVWTDSLQAAVFIGGAVAMLAAVIGSAPGGAEEIWRWAQVDQRTQIFHVDAWLSWTNTQLFGVATLGGFFLTLATHTTDHDMVQRLLTTRDGRSGGRALVASALLNFPLTALFLAVGTGLAFFYSTPPAYDISDTPRIVPLFALAELPSGARGLLFAGVFAAAMSSFDSAICAIATTWVTDIAPRKERHPDPLLRARRVSALFCGLLIAAALAMVVYERALADNGPSLSLVELALSAMTLVYGGLLGVFVRALWSRKPLADRAGVAGLWAGTGVGVALFLHPVVLGTTLLAWTWWIPAAAAISLGVARSLDRTAPAQ